MADAQTRNSGGGNDARAALDDRVDLLDRILRAESELQRLRKARCDEPNVVRGGIIDVLQAIQELLGPDLAKRNESSAASIVVVSEALEMCTEAMARAIDGNRYWLTALPDDRVNAWSEDPSGLKIKAAALLHHFAAQMHGKGKLARKIAEAMTQGGFTTERGRGPQGRTVEDWSNRFAPTKQAHSPSDRERKHYDALIAQLKSSKPTLEEALRGLEDTCQNFATYEARPGQK